jgi:HEAT repeat protein
VNAATALGKINDIEAVEPLIQALKDNNSDVRVNAATALGEIGKPSVEPLIKALRGER